MKSVTVTIAVEGGGSVSATLPAGDVMQAIIFAGMRTCDDGEWTWDMQEREPERLKAVDSFLYSAHDLLGSLPDE